MSENYSKPQPAVTAGKSDQPARKVSRWYLAGLPLWTLASFVGAQVIVVSLLYALRAVGVSFSGVSETVFNTSVAAVVYVISLVIVIALPWLVHRRPTSLRLLGLHRLPSWKDILYAPGGYIVYVSISAMLMLLVTNLSAGFDPSQQQAIGFENLTKQYEYILAFLTLVVLAPVAEEILFRGYLYGKLRMIASFWLTTIIASILFGALHLFGGDSLQWNVALDVFALSIVLCGLRELTGSIWAGILLHMLKNGLAFYLLFINPTLLNTMGG